VVVFVVGFGVIDGVLLLSVVLESEPTSVGVGVGVVLGSVVGGVVLVLLSLPLSLPLSEGVGVGVDSEVLGGVVVGGSEVVGSSLVVVGGSDVVVVSESVVSELVGVGSPSGVAAGLVSAAAFESPPSGRLRESWRAPTS
jgi:hypothetical protein